MSYFSTMLKQPMLPLEAGTMMLDFLASRTTGKTNLFHPRCLATENREKQPAPAKTEAVIPEHLRPDPEGCTRRGWLAEEKADRQTFTASACFPPRSRKRLGTLLCSIHLALKKSPKPTRAVPSHLDRESLIIPNSNPVFFFRSQ